MFLVALVVIIPLVLSAGLAWYAQASNQPAPVMAAGDPQAATMQDASTTSASDDNTTDTVPAPQEQEPDNDQSQASTEPSRERPETVVGVDLDMSGGKGEFTESRAIPAAQKLSVQNGQRVLPTKLQVGDKIKMSGGLIGLVTNIEPAKTLPAITDPNAGRVQATCKHLTSTILYLRTANEEIGTTPQHPFYVVGHGWVNAGNLKKGDLIQSSNGPPVAVVSTRIGHVHPTYVYNLEVEDSHTFNVGKEGLLVHNGDCVPEVLDDTPASTPIGRQHSLWDPNSGSEVEVAPGTNTPGNVYGRDYTGHAFDRMQQRGIFPSDVEGAIQNGTQVPGKYPGTFMNTSPDTGTTVITNSSGGVVTVY